MTIRIFERLKIATWEKTAHEKLQDNSFWISVKNEKGEGLVAEVLTNGYVVRVPGMAKFDASMLSGVTQDIKVSYKDHTYRVGQLSVIGGYAIPTPDKDHDALVQATIAAERASKLVGELEERIATLERAYLGSNITQLN